MPPGRLCLGVGFWLPTAAGSSPRTGTMQRVVTEVAAQECPLRGMVSRIASNVAPMTLSDYRHEEGAAAAAPSL